MAEQFTDRDHILALYRCLGELAKRAGLGPVTATVENADGDFAKIDFESPRQEALVASKQPEFFTIEEVVMLRFLAICQPSLDSERYAAVEDTCQYLAQVRRGLQPESLDKCWRHISYLA